jgi:ArsR family transcriptional regulator, arsenate/arsenite/antimonite-responsive transcriptional repressor
MRTHDDLTYMASLYMALADRTRLRILNLLNEREVCVAYFSDVLGDSQPKISRHLAYLRNAGIVEARREGKWMHYRINWPVDEAMSGVVRAALNSLAHRDACAADRDKYLRSFGQSAMSAKAHQSQHLDIYAEAYMYDNPSETECEEPSHNELDEFLL